ncbi:MAG: metal-sulfur cluster assembly factor [Candidatus Bipolaricaulis sp.]|nr:metal-sulfur cluster assembly factor [Candidatus Bipolaricaulis sp.]
MTKEHVMAALRGVTDPELGISIVDLGLIYDVRLGDGRVDVDMTLTSSGCPMGRLIASDAEEAIRQALPGVDVAVRVVWDPPWTADRLSADARRTLGYDG